jgi:vancomycin aglycone glucosyltransferase
MKCVVAGYGSRGHDVRMAVTVPPDMAAVVESAGLTALPYGREWQDRRRDQLRHARCWVSGR